MKEEEMDKTPSIEVIRWVQDHGGIEEIEKRLMPEGIEWPRFEDGEPVRIGDKFNEHGGCENVANSIEIGDYWFKIHGFDGAMPRYSKGASVKRPAPKVLDADGAEIRVGDAVYDKSGTVCEVVKVYPDTCEVAVRWCRPDGDWRYAVINARTLTHERPDSWERLEEDAGKSVEEYWGCSDFDCTSCPAMVGGKRPREKYDVGSCGYAVSLDLVRRAKALAGVK